MCGINGVVRPGPGVPIEEGPLLAMRDTLTHRGPDDAGHYPDLRSHLEARGHSFASNTDTEVILRLYAEEGAAMLPRLNGMFALAVWDAREREERHGRPAAPRGASPPEMGLRRALVQILARPAALAEYGSGSFGSRADTQRTIRAQPDDGSDPGVSRRGGVPRGAGETIGDDRCVAPGVCQTVRNRTDQSRLDRAGAVAARTADFMEIPGLDGWGR